MKRIWVRELVLEGPVSASEHARLCAMMAARRHSGLAGWMSSDDIREGVSRETQRP